MRCRFISDGDVWTKARGVSNLPSTLHSNVSPIAGIATDGFVTVLEARLRAAGGGDEKRAEAQLSRLNSHAINTTRINRMARAILFSEESGFFLAGFGICHDRHLHGL